MQKKVFIITALLLVLTWFIFQRPPSRESLPVLGQVKPFHLTGADGLDFSSTTLSGKIWVADFIFTTCSGICPVMSDNMSALVKDFTGTNAVHFVSISANPEQDDPERLSLYAEHYNADQKSWFFLTGKRESIHELAINSFKVGSVENPLMHSDRFILVDQNFQIRGYYVGTETKDVQKLKQHMQQLLGSR